MIKVSMTLGQAVLTRKTIATRRDELAAEIRRLADANLWDDVVIAAKEREELALASSAIHHAIRESTEQNSGGIALRNGFTFFWMRALDGEVSGHVSGPDGHIVQNSFGWWKTPHEHDAASRAEQLFVPE